MSTDNEAERAIRTFNARFLSTLATCDSEFPIAEWDRSLQRSELTLNLLQPVCCNPNLSAYAYLDGNLDYNETPLAPLGTKVFIHSKPSQQKSWGYHGQISWYVGPALHHYHCFRCFVPQTGTEIITDTVHFLLKKVTFPTKYLSDRLICTVNKITHMTNMHHHALTPMLPNKDAIIQALFRNAGEKIKKLGYEVQLVT